MNDMERIMQPFYENILITFVLLSVISADSVYWKDGNCPQCTVRRERSLLELVQDA